MTRDCMVAAARALHWDGQSARDIAALLGVAESIAHDLIAEAYGTPAESDPSPDDLRLRAAEERARWSEAERIVRRKWATSVGFLCPSRLLADTPA